MNTELQAAFPSIDEVRLKSIHALQNFKAPGERERGGAFLLNAAGSVIGSELDYAALDNARYATICYVNRLISDDEQSFR